MILEKHIFPASPPSINEHIFVVEDKSSRKVKYIAVGCLNNTKLNFFRVRFRNELSLSLNFQKEDDLFYHPTVHGYYKFDYESMKEGDCTPYSCDESVKPLSITVKQ
jgi:hypothetical protein